jgi:hypothetical protein
MEPIRRLLAQHGLPVRLIGRCDTRQGTVLAKVLTFPAIRRQASA